MNTIISFTSILLSIGILLYISFDWKILIKEWKLSCRKWWRMHIIDYDPEEVSIPIEIKKRSKTHKSFWKKYLIKYRWWESRYISYQLFIQKYGIDDINPYESI